MTPFRFPSFGTSVNGSLLLASLAAVGCGPSHTELGPPAFGGNHQTSIRVEPGSLTLGDLYPGQAGHGEATLRNITVDPITVEVIETTCPCLRAKTVPATVGANQAISMLVDFDSSAEPDFRGNLAIGVTGRDSSGLVLFLASVQIRILDRPASPGPDSTHPSGKVVSR